MGSSEQHLFAADLCRGFEKGDECDEFLPLVLIHSRGMTPQTNRDSTCCIIMLHWNDPDRVVMAANRILAWRDFTPGLVIVDNGSSHEAWQILSNSLPGEYLLRSEKNLGFAGGNNLGIRYALEKGFDLVMLLNTDVSMKENDARELYERMAISRDLAISGPRVRETRADGVHLLAGGRDIGRYLNSRIEIPPSEKSFNSPGEAISHIPGMLIVIRSTLFEKVGVLDERFFFSGEIADFCARATEAGYRLGIDHEIVVDHDTTLDNPDRRNTLYLYYSLRNRFLYVHKHHPNDSLRLKILWTIRGARQFLGYALSGRGKAARSVAWALWHGNRSIFGNQNDRFINGD